MEVTYSFVNGENVIVSVGEELANANRKKIIESIAPTWIPPKDV